VTRASGARRGGAGGAVVTVSGGTPSDYSIDRHRFNR
jgi:hypothetical protein